MDNAGAAVVPADLRGWLFETVLPFWATVGLDRDAGGFVERLTCERVPAPVDYKRAMVQARQIYVYSHAWMLGAPAWTLEAAWHGFTFLTGRYWDAAAGGWVHTVTRAGRPLDLTRDLYDHAFVLLAMAWLYRATGDEAPLSWARRTIDVLDRRLIDPHHGGYHEALREGGREIPLPRRQNPHMHLLEALLALHAATGERYWVDRARRLIELFHRHFYDAGTGSLGEYFTADWQPAPGGEGALREPGHHFEWVWLLHRYHQASGDQSVIEPAQRLYAFALGQGIDREPGMLPGPFDLVDRSGAVVGDGKRLWPQTEAIKAFLARREFLGDPDAKALVEATLSSLFTGFISAGHAVWCDRTTRSGAPATDFIPASSLYHVFLCVAEILRVLGR